MKKLLIALFSISLLSAYAFSAPRVTVINGANTNQLAVNSDGSVNVSISGTSFIYNSTVTVNGAIIATGTITAGGYVGNTSSATVPAGQVGEIVQQIFPVLSAAPSAQWITCSTITLTAGSWEIWAIAISSGNGATYTAGVDFATRISTTNAVTSQGTNNNTLGLDWMPESPNVTGSATYIESSTYPLKIFVNIATSTTYYLLGEASYSSGTPKWFGSMTACRIR